MEGCGIRILKQTIMSDPVESIPEGIEPVAGTETSNQSIGSSVLTSAEGNKLAEFRQAKTMLLDFRQELLLERHDIIHQMRTWRSEVMVPFFVLQTWKLEETNDLVCG
jgi:hypothetical protein